MYSTLLVYFSLTTAPQTQLENPEMSGNLIAVKVMLGN